jgi:hypothetical protein
VGDSGEKRGSPPREPEKISSGGLTASFYGTAMHSLGVVQKRWFPLVFVKTPRQLAHNLVIRRTRSAVAEFSPRAQHLFGDEIEDIRTGPGHI